MALLKNNDKYYIDSGCFINRVKASSSIKQHTHDFIEFTYTYHGKCTHIVDGQEYTLSRGDLLFINYGSSHAIKSATDCEYIDILIKPEFIDESLKGKENAFSLLILNDFTEFEKLIDRKMPVIHFSKEERSEIEYLISISEKENKERKTGENLIIKSCINIFLINIFRKMTLPMNNFSGIDEELLKFIKDNCSLNLKLHRLAEKCNYNPSYFSRLFKKTTNLSFSEYLNNARLELSCKLLTKTNMQVDKIIEKCGISDRSKFFRDFAEKYGTTPKKFRSLYKN